MAGNVLFKSSDGRPQPTTKTRRDETAYVVLSHVRRLQSSSGNGRWRKTTESVIISLAYRIRKIA
jgi:hypothetical protein